VFWQFSLFHDVVEKLASCCIFHNHIYGRTGLYDINELDDVWVFDGLKYFDLSIDSFDIVFLLYSGLFKYLDRHFAF
jgi:hypothetical protein